MTILLEVEGAEAGYGTSQVLFDLRLRVAAGSVATLLGRNGMGKTTTIRTVLRLLPLRKGEVRFDGQRIDTLSTDAIGRLGIALVPEGRQIFPNLTVRENLVAFAANRARHADPWTLDKVLAFFPRLAERADNMGNQLSGGEQQMLAIGRALMTNPRLLILDEATEGLAPVIRDEIWACLAGLKREGLSILVIDKNLATLKRLADRHVVIEKGRTLWRGDAEALAREEARVHAAIGL